MINQVSQSLRCFRPHPVSNHLTTDNCVSTVGVAEEVIRDYIRKQEADEKKQEKLELG